MVQRSKTSRFHREEEGSIPSGSPMSNFEFPTKHRGVTLDVAYQSDEAVIGIRIEVPKRGSKGYEHAFEAAVTIDLNAMRELRDSLDAAIAARTPRRQWRAKP